MGRRIYEERLRQEYLELQAHTTRISASADAATKQLQLRIEDDTKMLESTRVLCGELEQRHQVGLER